MRYHHRTIRIVFPLFLVLVAMTAHAQRIRFPQRSTELPELSADEASSSTRETTAADRAARVAERSVERAIPALEADDVGSDLDINIDLPTEPRVASLTGPSTGLSGLAIADGFVNLDGCGPNCNTCPPSRTRRFGIFAEALFLRPGGADVVYAIEQTGTDPLLSSPTGQVGKTSPDFATGLRIGGSWLLRSGAEARATYTWLPSETTSSIVARTGTVLASQVTHPSLPNVGTNSLSASALQNIDQQLFDLDFVAPFCSGCDTEVRYLAGVRYARLDQKFTAQQLTGVATGLSTVSNQIKFDGVGVRLGLEGERRNSSSGLLIYGRGVTNFLGGEFNARYGQVNQFGGAVPVVVNSENYRIVSLLEAELGFGWVSPGGRWRLTGGYLINAWFNTLTSSDYINGVQARSIDDLSSTLTFDGVVARAEWQF